MFAIFVDMKKIEIASVALIDLHGRLLLVRKKGSEFFQLVGGKIGPGERLLDTVIREAKEEIGLDLVPDALTFLGQHTTAAVNEQNTLVCGNVYTSFLTFDFTPTVANEIEAFAWLDYDSYKNYLWAHLAEELVLPWWLALK